MANEIKTNSIGMKLALIPAGTFVIGSPADEPGRDADEGPQHRVRLTRDFWMGVYPVTQREYEQVTGQNFSKTRGADHPVELVNFDAASEFLRLLSEREGAAYDLPTESQWEYACRAGRAEAALNARELPDHAWFADNSENRTHSVGMKKPNAWGLHDMLGNVWEWCRDMWDPRGYLPVVEIDPVHAGFTNILRGGCYYSEADVVRCAKRFGYYAGNAFGSVGFRVICEVT